MQVSEQFQLKIIQLLEEMQTQNASEAQQRILKLSADPSFMPNMLSIIKVRKSAQWLKTVACSVVNSLIEKNAAQINSLDGFNIVFEVLRDSNVKDINKRCFERGIIKLIENATQETLIEIQKVIVEMMDQRALLDPSYLLFACVSVSDIPSKYLTELVSMLFRKSLTQLAFTIENAALLNQLTKTWVVIFDKLTILNELQTITEIICYSQLYNFIDQIFMMESFAEWEVIVCVKEGLEELNLLKYEAAELNKRVISLIVKNEIDINYPINHLRKNIPRINNTLFLLAQKRDMIEKLGCQDLITTLISLYVFYFDTISEIDQKTGIFEILNKIIFPFLKINDEEMVAFEDSPQDFNTLAEDCCDKQTYGILKTESSKLLELIADKIQGCLQYCMYRCITSLNTQICKIPFQHVEGENILEVETCFTILSILSYALDKSPIHLEQLHTIFKTENLISKLTHIEKARIFIFLAYNYEETFRNNREDGMAWIHYALTFNGHPSIEYSGLDFISNLVEEYFNMSFFGEIVNLIDKCRYGSLWQILEKIVREHHEQLPPQAFKILIQKLFLRIQKELKKVNQSKGEDAHTLNITNAFHVIREIMEMMIMEIEQSQSKSIQAQKRGQYVVDLVFPIAKYYKQLIKYDIEDEIVKIFSKMITIVGVDKRFQNAIGIFIEIFQKNGSYQKIYLRFFNSVILKINPSQHIDCFIQICKSIVDSSHIIINKMLSNKKKSSDYHKISFATLLIILQNLIALHGNFFIQENWIDLMQQVGSLCLKILPDKQIEKTASSKILMSRSLNLLFLCHMFLRSDIIFSYLGKLKSENIYHGYDTRVLVISICKEVEKQTDISKIVLLINCMAEIVKSSEEKNQKLSIKKTKLKQLNEKQRNIVKIIEDYDRVIRKIDSPFFSQKTLKEIMKELFWKIRRSNQQLYQIVVKGTGQNFQYLQQFLELAGNEQRVFRKIVGPKMSEQSLEIQRKKNNKHENLIGMEEQDEDEEKVSFKRQRIKDKISYKTGKKGEKKKIINPLRKIRN